MGLPFNNLKTTLEYSRCQRNILKRCYYQCDLIPEYSIRPYESGDEEDIVELLKLVFNGWPNFDLDCGPVDHWRWKYLHSPAGKSLIYVGESEGDIVGSSHTYTVNLKMGERILKCGFV